MPAAVIAETAYACWDWFRCDNAKAHLADHTLERLTDVIGCLGCSQRPAIGSGVIGHRAGRGPVQAYG